MNIIEMMNKSFEESNKFGRAKGRKLTEAVDPIMNEAPGGPVVNLRKYGWVPSPEEHFSDDGTYFSTYRYYPEGYDPNEKSNLD